MEFELRPLNARDIAPVARIISKIGIREMKNVVSIDAILSTIGDEEDRESKVDVVGFGIVLDAVGVICENLDKAESDIFKLMASVAGMKEKSVAELPLGDFADLLVAFLQKDDFKDFFTRVLKLAK